MLCASRHRRPMPIADVLLGGACSSLFQKSDVRHSDQWHKEARDQREREALHDRSNYRTRESRPQVEGTEEDCVNKIRDPKRVPPQERLAETKLIVTGHACGNPRGSHRHGDVAEPGRPREPAW